MWVMQKNVSLFYVRIHLLDTMKFGFCAVGSVHNFQMS